MHDTALLGGQHQDFNLDKHCYLLPHKYVGDFDALGPRLREVSAASDESVAKLVNRLQKRFRGQPGEPCWWPYRGGQLDRGDPELVRVARVHGERALDVVASELAHIEAVGASGGYATVVEWDWQRDRRMDTHAAVEQLVRQYAELREHVRSLASAPDGERLAEFDLGAPCGADALWVRLAHARIERAEARARDAELRAHEAERRASGVTWI